MTRDQLTTELEALRAQLAAIDLPAARERVSTTAADSQRAQQAEGRGYPGAVPGFVPISAEVRRDLDRTAEAAKRARSDLVRLESKDVTLRRRIAHLDGMLNGEARVEQALQMVEAAAAEVKDAEAAVAAAEEARAKIDSLVRDEASDLERGRKDAGAQILAAVKSGGDAAAIAPASRDKLAALEVAKVSAEQELAAARSALKVPQGRHAAAVQALNLARASVAELAYTFALDAYTQAAGAFMAAHWQAHRSSTRPADVLAAAQQVCTRILEQGEAA